MNAYCAVQAVEIYGHRDFDQEDCTLELLRFAPQLFVERNVCTCAWNTFIAKSFARSCTLMAQRFELHTCGTMHRAAQLWYKASHLASRCRLPGSEKTPLISMTNLAIKPCIPSSDLHAHCQHAHDICSHDACTGRIIDPCIFSIDKSTHCQECLIIATTPAETCTLTTSR